jgi:membrane fusion protein (multidrug efflux system)
MKTPTLNTSFKPLIYQLVDKRKTTLKNLSLKQKIAYAGVAAILIFSTLSFYWSHYEETDNAYTSAHVATLSSKISAPVVEVLVEENYRVKKDQVLVRLDSRDFENTLQNLKAELGSIEASLSFAKKDDARWKELLAEGAVSERDRDHRKATFDELRKKRDALLAKVAQAELDLKYTEIKAPSDGTIGKKLVEAGMMVGPNQPLLSFVDAQTPWVIANFKETQLKKMAIGQPAEIEIDSIGGKRFAGEIESFAPGTGATFALIPPDNATGNFTKIVQRVQVRIRFLPDAIKGYEDRIVPGLSSEVTVHLNQLSKK